MSASHAEQGSTALDGLRELAEGLAGRDGAEPDAEPLLARWLAGSAFASVELHVVGPDGQLALRARHPSDAPPTAPATLAAALVAAAPVLVDAARSGVALPVVARERLGVLVLHVPSGRSVAVDELAAAQALAALLSLSLSLGRAAGRQADAELRQRALMEHASDVVFVVDLAGRVLDVNGRAEGALRRTRAALVGRAWVDLLAPAGRGAARTALETTRRAGAARADGLAFDSTGGPREVDVSLALVDGGAERAVLVIARDASERLRGAGAPARTQERLLQSQKMEAIGRLAGGVAHDFNNALTAILGFAEVLAERLHGDSGSRSAIDQILKAGARASALTRQLLAVSRTQLVQPRILDLNAVVGDVERLLQRVMGEDVKVASALAPSVWPVRADASQVEHVLLTLAVNAREAMPGGGELRIETANAHVAGKEDDPPIPAGEYVLLSVCDSGAGLTQAELERVFEPFAGSRPDAGGSRTDLGLGLSALYGIVRQAGAFVLAESSAGAGTTFRTWWPRAGAPADQLGSAPVAPPVGGHETVLLVEDDDLVRRLVERTLGEQGYSVLVASDPGAAVGLVHAHAGTIHLLLTDLVLPVMDGRQLARQVAEARPGTKVLFMSGYVTGPTRSLDDLQGAFLRKPFTGSTLARAVRDVLDGHRVG